MQSGFVHLGGAGMPPGYGFAPGNADVDGRNVGPGGAGRMWPAGRLGRHGMDQQNDNGATGQLQQQAGGGIQPRTHPATGGGGGGGGTGRSGQLQSDRSLHGKASPAQKSFWQAITVGDLETVKCLLEHREISINMYDVDGEQRQGGTALHLAILEMPTWKGSEGRNGIQTAEFVKKFIRLLLDHGADIEKVCRYKGEWYLQTAAGKTKSFFPEGYDSLGLVLQFIEITRGADVIANDVTKRLELIRDILLEHIHAQHLRSRQLVPGDYHPQLSRSLLKMFEEQKYTDVEVHCEGRIFKVHRVVLAARSVVFDTMFSSALRESRSNVVEVKEVEPEALHAFLKFMYTDTIDDNHVELSSDLLVLANRYDVQDLKDLCTQSLAKDLTVQNAANILSIADACHAPALKRCALHFISRNIKTISTTSREYHDLDANLMREIIDTVVDYSSQPRTQKDRLSELQKMHTSTPMSVTGGNATFSSPAQGVPTPPPASTSTSSSSSSSSATTTFTTCGTIPVYTGPTNSRMQQESATSPSDENTTGTPPTTIEVNTTSTTTAESSSRSAPTSPHSISSSAKATPPQQQVTTASSSSSSSLSSASSNRGNKRSISECTTSSGRVTRSNANKRSAKQVNSSSDMEEEEEEEEEDEA